MLSFQVRYLSLFFFTKRKKNFFIQPINLHNSLYYPVKRSLNIFEGKSYKQKNGVVKTPFSINRHK